MPRPDVMKENNAMRTESTASYLDLFNRPRFLDKGFERPDGRALVPVKPALPPSVIHVRVRAEDLGLHASDLRDIKEAGAIDVRNISPRQIAALSLDFYVTGALSYEEYDMLAFQPELHRDYDQTIGALLGETAAPDQRRDFVKIWEERYEFECHYNGDDRDVMRQTKKILDVLRALDQTLTHTRM